MTSRTDSDLSVGTTAVSGNRSSLRLYQQIELSWSDTTLQLLGGKVVADAESFGAKALVSASVPLNGFEQDYLVFLSAPIKCLSMTWGRWYRRVSVKRFTSGFSDP